MMSNSNNSNNGNNNNNSNSNTSNNNNNTMTNNIVIVKVVATRSKGWKRNFESRVPRGGSGASPSEYNTV